MYEKFWGFREPPFATGLASSACDTAQVHEEALARLHFLLSGHRRLGLLLGEWGIGKSHVLDVFAGQLKYRPCQVAKFSALGCDVCEFLATLACGLGVNPEVHRTQRDLWTVVADRLTEFQYQRMAAVVLVDDVDDAVPEVLVQLARLAQWPGAAETHLTIVLAARRERMLSLGRRLLELADLRIDLWPWTADAVRQYIETALRNAGRKEPAFNDDALVRLHELSQGIPRRVQQLAELALVAAAARKAPRVDTATLDGVFEELAVPEPA
ncbi:MAG TPA: AAA family ATPase [Pirellulales bacterium]|nr:AAA family ATPase [Pirellulales bacterium]